MRHQEAEHLEYVTGLAEFERLALDTTFMDFVGLYDAEGSLGSGDVVSFSTADPIDAALAAHWMRRLSGSRIGFVLDVDSSHDVVELVRFWTQRLHVDHERLRLRHRRFHELRTPIAEASPLGVLTVRSSDPILRVRLQAWMDKARANLARAAH